MKEISAPRDPEAIEELFERRIDELIASAHAACLKRLSWRPEEHERIQQDAIGKALDDARCGRIDPEREDLVAYVHRMADHAIRTFKRQWSRALQRQCELPEDDVFDSLLADTEPASGSSLERLLQDEERRKLFGILRYYVVHLYSASTEGQRDRAVRDTYILARHELRGVPLGEIARELGLTPGACSHARDRTLERLRALLDHSTGEARSFVENSELFTSLSELTQFLKLRIGA